jgi:hypothetical protein
MVIVIQAEKIIKKMKTNPRDWRIENLKSAAEANNIAFRQPGGSHVIFRHANGAMLSVNLMPDDFPRLTS